MNCGNGQSDMTGSQNKTGRTWQVICRNQCLGVCIPTFSVLWIWGKDGNTFNVWVWVCGCVCVGCVFNDYQLDKED